MKDDALILSGWREARDRGTPAILATVVQVSGSAYRSPGARMLVTENGGRIGSISGGCLEGDVLRKAWWLTGESATAIRVYDNSSEEEAIWEFGLGCNGVVHVLLERWESGSGPLTIDLLKACQTDRRGGALATFLSGPALGRKLAVFPDGTIRSELDDSRITEVVAREAELAHRSRESAYRLVDSEQVYIEFLPSPAPLVVVGAGHDVRPVVKFAKELGWHVTVIDGHVNQAKPERFPLADRVLVAELEDPLRDLVIDDQTSVVLMSHSYRQDSVFIGALDGLPLRYLGVLGPRKRTERMMSEGGFAPHPALQSPVGLDIGADTPEEIALAITSEIQAVIGRRKGGMLTDRPGPIHDERRERNTTTPQPMLV